MDSVPMTQFLDFALTSGTGKVTAIKLLRLGQDERFSDFCRPVREAIVDMHQKGLAEDHLDWHLVHVTDPREQRIFPKVVSGYKKFLRSGKMVWFEPPMRHYPLGPITVRVAPEVGLLIDGRPHAIKLYFRGDPLSPQRAMVTNELLAGAFSATWPGTVCAVLDVRRGRLYPYWPKREIGHLLRAEAACFSSLWAALG